MSVLKNRYEFVVLFDVENGNPNGDPDAGNMPRVDSETNFGIVTDVCLKRKVRNYVDLVKNGEPGYKIYVQQDEPLNKLHEQAYIELGIKDNLPSEKQTGQKKSKADIEREKMYLARDFMCKNFYDIRTFGAVMSTGDYSCGTVRGPIQINFARSIDPIFQQDITITRMAITSESDFAKKTNEMGRKHIIPYALYRVEGYVSAALAQNVTGFSESDLELFWEAIINMFEHDHSAARGKMSVRKLIIFKHSSLLGDAPSHILFDTVKVEKINNDIPPRNFSDYKITIDREVDIDKVEIIEKL